VIIDKLSIKILIFILPIFISLNLKGQSFDVDSTKIVELDTQLESVHSAKKAARYSALLPGLGQAYNKKYWKIPIIYATFGGIGYSIHWNNKNYKIIKQAYSDITDDDDDTDSYLDLEYVEYYDLTDATEKANYTTNLNSSQEYYRRNRDLLFISFIAFYGLNIIDASVDAHFFDFDMSEDLTFNWQPNVYRYKNQNIYGINCTFTF
jgi:hypothetical protein